jgi:transcriptional regulator with XRE-family HTH domain
MSGNVKPVPMLVHLRELRLRSALSQADLADRAGLARTTVVRLEKGDPNSTPTTLRKLARALRVKPAELLED